MSTKRYVGYSNQYNYEDIQEAQKFGFEECKKKVLEIFESKTTIRGVQIYFQENHGIIQELKREIEKL